MQNAEQNVVHTEPGRLQNAECSIDSEIQNTVEAETSRVQNAECKMQKEVQREDVLQTANIFSSLMEADKLLSAQKKYDKMGRGTRKKVSKNFSSLK